MRPLECDDYNYFVLLIKNKSLTGGIQDVPYALLCPLTFFHPATCWTSAITLAPISCSTTAKSYLD
jgi:hypothetical protein